MVDETHIMRIYTMFSALSILASFFWFSLTVIGQTVGLNDRRITKLEERLDSRMERLFKLETSVALVTAQNQQVEKKLDELETLLKTIGGMVGALAVNALTGLVRIAVKHYLPRHGDPK